MALRSKFKRLLDNRFGHSLTLFQGSTLKYLYSYLYFNFGRSPWLCIQGSNPSISGLEYNYLLEEPRGRVHEGRVYSYGYKESAPEVINVFTSIIIEHFADIQKVLGPDFLLNEPTFWRTKHIPRCASSLDLYSQVFHQDSVVDNFNIQIFVLLQDVNLSDGPLEWIDKEYHRKAFRQCHNRDKIRVNEIPVSRLTGKRNDYLILSTGQTLHRDGIPDDGRERIMASIGLFPKYTKIGKPLKAPK